MRSFIWMLLCSAAMFACDETRLYEKNADFNERVWIKGEKPEFEFTITDTAARYNLYCNLRNSVSYPYSRFFFTYYLQDSAGNVRKKDLMSTVLFEPKTGEPFGRSGLGDIYDHQFAILKNYQFPYQGKHRIVFEQFMRPDTLEGVLAVGVRVERALTEQ